MSLLSDQDRQHVQRLFEQLTSDVRLVFVTQTLGCDTCADARRILDEVVALSPRLALDEVNLVLERDRAAAYGIDVAPALAVVRVEDDGAEWDPGVRFYGLTSGYEFMSLLDAIVIVSRRDSGLADDSRALLATVTEPTHIQVFVTPT